MQAAELANLVPHLDTALFSVQHREPLFEELISELAALFERLHDTDALSALALALHHCAGLPQPPLADVAGHAADVLLTTCVKTLESAAAALAHINDNDLRVRG
jgi:hypothetical protein